MRIACGMCLLLLVAGCGTVRNEVMKLRSGVFTLDNRITLYAANGDTIQTWHVHGKVESAGGEAWWVDVEDNVQHHISGTFTVEGR